MKLLSFLVQKNVSFEKNANEWLQYKRISVKTSTFYRYQYILNQYILPYFKNETIYSLQHFNFNNFINQLSTSVSVKTIKDILIVVKAILKYISKKCLLEYSLDLIPFPKSIKEEVTILSEAEKETLENYCLTNTNLRKIGIMICLNTGMRIGEICALKWENIDLENKFFLINKSLQRIYKGKNNTVILIDSSKTQHSIRKIPISNKICEILKELKIVGRYTGEEYLLTGKSTKTIEPRNYQYFFKNCLSQCQLPNYNFHILRHTFASSCINIGMDPKTLSKLLGHSTVAITLDRYSYNIQQKYLNQL